MRIKQGVEFPGHTMVKAVIERHMEMLCQNLTAGCLPCQNGTTKHPHRRWWPKGTGAPPPSRRQPQTSEHNTEPTPPLPGSSPVGTSDTCGAQSLEITNLPAGYAYSHTFLPCAEPFTLGASAQDSEYNTDFDPDMLPDKSTSTG